METKSKIYSYKDLVVWQRAMELAVMVYDATYKFPKEEVYGITSQIRRSAVSVPSNIAEGRNRGTKKDFLQFLRIAFGSCAELGTQLELSKRLSYLKEADYIKIQSIQMEVSKMLRSIIYKFQHSEN